jgi:PAS domain-containing protein
MPAKNTLQLGTSREEILELIGQSERGVSVAVQSTYRQKTGEQRTMDLRLTRLGCPGGDLLVASGRDLREQKQLKEQLRELEQRIAERTADLAQINQTLQVEIDRRKKTEEALKQSEERLCLAIDTIPALVWSALPDGQLDYLNKRRTGGSERLQTADYRHDCLRDRRGCPPRSEGRRQRVSAESDSSPTDSGCRAESR